MEPDGSRRKVTDTVFCQAGVPDFQTISMSEPARRLYEQYRQLPNPEYFAITKDGRIGTYSYCPDIGPCQSNGEQLAVDNCRKLKEKYMSTNIEPCIVYAYKGKPAFE